MKRIRQLVDTGWFSKKKTTVAHFFSSSTIQVVLFASLSILVVIVTYVWFISFGTWTNWRTATTFYDQLATSFEAGQLSLKTTPSPALMALHNPYDPNERKGLKWGDYPGDVSLYRGKYYLYFGPAPALILLAVKPWITGAIGDQYETFIFVVGILILQSLLVIRFWNRFFSEAPPWIISLCILFVGLASPFTWILSQASIYITASAGGQFFFLAGLYLVFIALDRDSISEAWLFAAGVSFAFAIGSRLTQILPISFVVLMVASFTLWKYRQAKLFSKALYATASLGLPLVLGLGILGWYNWARFDSLFETGLYYQLAGPFIQKYYQFIFSIRYFLPNLYDYLVMQPKGIASFPYLKPIQGQGTVKFSFIDVPQIHNKGNVTGLFFTTPFILFAGIPIISMFLRKKSETTPDSSSHTTFIYKWTSTSLFGSFLLGFASLLAYYWVQISFLADCISPLLLLSVLGFWQGYQALNSKPTSRRIYLFIGISLIVVSIVISSLLACYVNAYEFRTFDTGF